MEEAPQIPGQQANEQFVTNTRNGHPELVDQIPADCLGCSSAWLHASRGNVERIQKCQGRSEVRMGELTVMLCHLPTPKT